MRTLLVVALGIGSGCTKVKPPELPNGWPPKATYDVCGCPDDQMLDGVCELKGGKIVWKCLHAVPAPSDGVRKPRSHRFVLKEEGTGCTMTILRDETGGTEFLPMECPKPQPHHEPGLKP